MKLGNSFNFNAQVIDFVGKMDEIIKDKNDAVMCFGMLQLLAGTAADYKLNGIKTSLTIEFMHSQLDMMYANMLETLKRTKQSEVKE
jgi:hypothetical protein